MFANQRGGELNLLCIVALVLFTAIRLPKFIAAVKLGMKEFKRASENAQDSVSDLSQPIAKALTHTNQTVETDPPPEPKVTDPFVVWFAQGFGIGRLKPAPGTWGTLLGVAWFAVLVAPGSLAVFLGGILVSVPVCAWACGEAEKALRQTDPPSVVLDEIIAVPLCFAAWILSRVQTTGQMPDVSYFFSGEHLLGVGGVFALFRLFDIWKPWPVRQSQSLPGGWGVTVDDLLAALYVNLVSLLFFALR